VRTALAAVRALRHERVTIRTTTHDETLDILLVAVANSDQYGNNARIAPGARVDDGLLDLIAVRPVGLVGAAVLTARLFLGNFDRSPDVRRMRGSRFVIERVAPGLIHTDGETHDAGTAIDVVVHPRSLRVLVPATSRAVAFPAVPADFALQLP
jgi:diacylglycerol kinase family enzyme